MKTKIKSVLQKITAGALALVFSATLALPKAYAVTGVDDVSVGIMAVLVHLDSIGGSLAVQQGTALATQNAVTALAAQAGAAGALGAGVTGTAALATIGGAVVASAAGGFTIGYVGYETLSKLAEWIRQSKLTGTAENKIFMSGGYGRLFSDGTKIVGKNLDFGKIYECQSGTSFWVNLAKASNVAPNAYTITAISPDGLVKSATTPYYNNVNRTNYTITGIESTQISFYYPGGSSILAPDEFPPTYYWKNYFPDPGSDYLPNNEKQEVTYVPPVTWSPPAPTLGQDVYYNPYPQMPQKPIKEIVEDVPKDIYDKKFDPAPPSILDPSVPPITPPNPDIPPVNPNPDVTVPEDVQPYIVRLGDVFPFCIPFDVYHMVTLFAAEPEAPHAKWEFSLPFTGGTYEIEWDLREWDEVAALCRKLELILFCVGLAVVTSKLIKW